jgi:hypothetical protein
VPAVCLTNRHGWSWNAPGTRSAPKEGNAARGQAGDGAFCTVDMRHSADVVHEPVHEHEHLRDALPLLTYNTYIIVLQ